MNFWVVLWILSIVMGMKKEKGMSGNVAEGLSYDNTLPLRGILAVEIVLGHFYGRVSDCSLIQFNNRAGVLVVGMFLFLSGWGLYESSLRKKNYFKGFLQKHLCNILLPVYGLYLITVFAFRDSYKLAPQEWIKEILGGHIFSFANWYIWELLLLYLVFYLLYKNFDYRLSNAIMIVGMIIFIVIGSYMQIGSRWYGSILCFILGIMCSQNKEQLSIWLSERIGRTISVSVILFLASLYIFLKFESLFIVNAIFTCLSSLLFCITAVVALSCVRIGNVLTCFLGKISYEVFIIHASLMIFWRNRLAQANDFVYTSVVIVSVIGISYIFNLVMGRRKRVRVPINGNLM